MKVEPGADKIEYQMQYTRRRSLIAKLLSLPAEATIPEIVCAIKCQYRTAQYWLVQWRKVGIVQRMARRDGYDWLYNRDRLIDWLIYVKRLHPPPEYGLGDAEDARRRLFGGEPPFRRPAIMRQERREPLR